MATKLIDLRISVDPPPRRRLRCYRLPADQVVEVLKENFDLPEDVRAHHNGKSFLFLFESPTFDEVPPGDVPPTTEIEQRLAKFRKFF